MNAAAKKRVFSGVQPTGNLHLGNYLGAIKNWVGLQNNYECIFCIVDLHAITVAQDPKALREATYQTLATYLACGIDAEKNTLFVQSAVPAHSELAWILGCHTPLGWLNRMTQFKEKAQSSKLGLKEELKHVEDDLEEVYRAVNRLSMSAKPTGALNRLKMRIETLKGLIDDINKIEKSNLGLYAYPVLMAADILLYKATHVPVGEDQKQHLELARDIAGAFNRAYKEAYAFPIPEPLILGEATRVMSLRDGTSKMSKSDESDYSRINLTDDADAIVKKFKKAKSDATVGFETLEGRPEAVNLLTIYATLAEIPMKKAQEKFMESGFAALKTELAEIAVEKLAPISTELKKLMGDKAYLEKILKKGEEKANAMAEAHMKEIKQLIGFVTF